MKRICILLIAVLAITPLYADEAKDKQATEASVRELLAATNSKKMLDAVFKQIDTSLERSVRRSMAGRNLNLEQQAIMDNMRKQLLDIYKSALSWDDYEPILVNIYRKTFTESEVQAMIKFYKSPAGRAVINKMPIVMQSSMRAAQGRMREVMPRLRALQQQTAQRMKDAAQGK